MARGEFLRGNEYCKATVGENPGSGKKQDAKGKILAGKGMADRGTRRGIGRGRERGEGEGKNPAKKERKVATG